MKLMIYGSVLTAALTFNLNVLADAGHSHGPKIGQPAKASAANRTVHIKLSEMAFQPDQLQVKAGETIHFVVTNEGQLLHEFNLGTAAMHAAHREEMAAMMEQGIIMSTGMDPSKMDHSKMGHGHRRHDDPNSVLVEPGQTAELTWTFPQTGTLEFACNVPGHSEAGMTGRVIIGH